MVRTTKQIYTNASKVIMYVTCACKKAALVGYVLVCCKMFCTQPLHLSMQACMCLCICNLLPAVAYTAAAATALVRFY